MNTPPLESPSERWHSFDPPWPSNTTRKHVANADTKIRDRRDVVFAPALDAVGGAPEPTVGLSTHHDRRAALRAAAEDDEMLVGFIRRRIQRGVTWKCLAHLPDGEVAVEGLEGGDRMIRKSLEEED